MKAHREDARQLEVSVTIKNLTPALLYTSMFTPFSVISPEVSPVARTILVETLVESHELRLLADSLPLCEERADLERRIADCEGILDYLRERFVEFNRYPAPPDYAEEPTTNLADMDNAPLLRYGTVLKYIVSVEASLQDKPLAALTAELDAARGEWRRRFPKSVITDSI